MGTDLRNEGVENLPLDNILHLVYKDFVININFEYYFELKAENDENEIIKILEVFWSTNNVQCFEISRWPYLTWNFSK